ncbi:MAG: hypothetical protein WD872_07460 [Pirellulaceae bacterium]
MRRFTLAIAAAALLGGALVMGAPQTAHADDDDYWDNHWSWYDGSYRPYHQRQYRSRPTYDRYDGYYDNDYGRGNSYGGRGYYNRGYNRGNYYGTPNIGYRDNRRGGGSVNIGGLRFGWR